MKLGHSAFLEVCNEADITSNGVDVYKIQPRDPGDLLWATGSYDMERIDKPGQPDPRPEMAKGRYVTYHGKRTLDGSLIEAAKEGHFYYDGWDTINHEGNRSYGQACKRPCVHDEPMGASDQPTNRWGDERYTDPEHARLMGAGHALSGHGTFHSESGCLSKPLTETELKCARAYFDGMRFVDVHAPSWPYEHDRSAGHKLAPVPHLGGELYAAGESVSRANAGTAYALTVLITHGYQPQGQHGWQITEKTGTDGGLMKLKEN